MHSEARQRLLVIFPGALGDLICALPAIRVIVARHPGADFELMARPELARFAVGHLGAVRGHSLDRRVTSHLFAPSIGLEAAREFFGVFNYVYSFFASDNQDFRKRLTAASAGPIRFMPFRPFGDFHITTSYLREADDPAASDARAEELSRIEIPAGDLAVAHERLGAIGSKPGGFWLILPGSGSPSKNWPAESFIDLARLLGPEMPSIALLGPAEAGLERRFNDCGIRVLTGLDLGVLAALAQYSRGFIGNDSGVSHLAASAGASGIVLFGPTDPARWRPLGPVEVIRAEPLNELRPIEVARHIAAMTARGAFQLRA